MTATFTAIYHAWPHQLVQRHYKTIEAVRNDYLLIKKEGLESGAKINRVQIFKKSQIKAIYDGPLK